jgi:hypothetical protein
MYEFIFLGALDAGNDTLIDGCIGPLMQKFPKGNRIRVLIGQWNEYRGTCNLFSFASFVFDYLCNNLT